MKILKILLCCFPLMVQAAVDNPSVLLVLNEASGTTVVNDGSVATDGSVGQGVEDTDWEWNQDTGSFDGYWRSLDQDGSDQAWIDLTGISTSADFNNEGWFAIAFNITSYHSTRGWIIGTENGGFGWAGGFTLYMEDDTSGTADFDLFVRVESGNGNQRSTIEFTDLDFSTDYQLVARVDPSDDSAVELRAKLDSGTVQSNSDADWRFGLTEYTGDAGYLGRGDEWGTNFGIIGNIYYFALDLNDAITDSDMADINSNPSGTITGWPGGVSNTSLRRRRSAD